MGLDISVIQTDKNKNLSNAYVILDALIDHFDWYLGGVADLKKSTYRMLKDRLSKMTKQDIISACDDGSSERDRLESISDDEFNMQMDDILRVVGMFNPINSHLSFEYAELPGNNIYDSCSWYTRELLLSCKIENGCNYNDWVVELDNSKLIELNKTWTSYKKKLTLMKWIGFLFPTVKNRMLYDFCETNGIDRDDSVNFFIWRANDISKIVSQLDVNKRTWLISSY